MKRKLWPAGTLPAEVGERKGAIKAPQPSPEQRAREDEQVRLLQAAVGLHNTALEGGKCGGIFDTDGAPEAIKAVSAGKAHL